MLIGSHAFIFIFKKVQEFWQKVNALDFTIEMTKRIRFYDKTSYNIMHDCALGRERSPSAPRVEHRLIVDTNPPTPGTFGAT